MALLGIIEPEVLRAKVNRAASAAGAEPTSSVTLGPSPSNSLAAAPSSSSSAMTPRPSLGEIARAYRGDAATRIAANSEEVRPGAERPSDETHRVAPSSSNQTQIAASVLETASAHSTQTLAGVPSPEPAATKQAIAAPAPVLSTAAEASGSGKIGVNAAPQVQLSPVKQEVS